MRFTVERRVVSEVAIDVPAEILVNIFAQLVASGEIRTTRIDYPFDLRDTRGAFTDDIKKARLVCRAFNFAASPFLIPTVFLSSSTKDLETLRAVAEHPVFSKHVLELVYDCRMFVEALTTDRHSYIEELKRMPLCHFGEGTVLTKNLAKQSFKAYIDHFKQQKLYREQGLDMKCLEETFPFLPNLANVSIRGRSRTRFVLMSRRLIPRPDRRATEAFMVPPQARMLYGRDDRTTGHNAVCQKGVLDFLRTISFPNIARQIRSLSLGHPTDQEELRLSSELFGPDINPVGLCGNLFRDLTDVHLTVRIGDEQDDQWGPPPAVGGTSQDDQFIPCQARLRWALGFARGLEVLRLTFRTAYRRPGNDIQLNQIFDGLTFAHLVELRLTSMRCQQSTLLDFVLAHRGVLRRLSLHDVFFVDNTWTFFLDSLKAMDLGLESCELGLRYPPELHFSHARYVPSSAVLDYLKGDGENPLEDITPEDLTVDDLASTGTSPEIMEIIPGLSA